MSNLPLTLPRAEYPGHSFDDWYTDETLLVRAVAPEVPADSTGNKEFYARYPHTVTFETGGGSKVPGITAIEKGATINEPAQPTQGGYDFGGWYKDNSTFASPWNFDTDTVREDTTLYAKWTLATYRIFYAERGGSAVPADIVKTYTIESSDITLPVITREGYRFKGWYEYDKNNVLTGPVKEIKKGEWGDRHFEAVWEQLYPITLHLKGGDLAAGDWGARGGSALAAGDWVKGSDAAGYTYTMQYTESDSITLPVPEYSGQFFGGWFTKADYTESAGTPPEVPTGSTGDKEFYAKWTAKPTITLYLMGGDLPAGHDWGAPISTNPSYRKEYTAASLPITLPTPVPPASSGYLFDGWFTDANFNTSAGTPPEVPAGSTGNKEFWAKWFIPVTSITYTGSTTMEVNTSITLSGTAIPTNATNRTISSWIVVSAGGTGATISGSTLSATTAGTVTVRATIANGTAPGTAFTQTFTITVTPPMAWFYKGTPDTGEEILRGPPVTTRIGDAKTWLAANGEANTLYTLVLDSGFSQAPVTLSGLASGITLVVTTRYDTETARCVVELSGSGSLFTVDSAVTLVLDRRVTLKGISGTTNNTAALVVVNGTFAAQGNAKITGNTNSSAIGGGVTVNNGGTFTMSGSASVSDNSTTFGGGVYVYNGGTFTMSGGSVSNNTASGGGGIENNGTFLMSGGSVSGNTASSNGGGIHANAGTFTLSGSASVSGNSAASGGGVDVYPGGTFTMSGGSVSSNTASGNGGGVYVASSGTFNLNGGSVSGNSAASGGGVYSSAAFTMNNSASVSGNYASASGGGVYVNSGTFTMNNSASVSGSNRAGASGGGVYTSGTFNLNGGSVSSNYAYYNSSTSSYGGGVYVAGGAFTMGGGEVKSNRAYSSGGGVYVADSGTFTLNSGSVQSNYAYGSSASFNGGGVYVNSGTFTMSGGEVKSNAASCDGGGVFVTTSGTFTMGGGEVKSNTASTSGGGVYTSGTSSMSGSASVSGNTASSSGGGVFVGSGTFTMAGSASVSGNSSSSSTGGGVYVHSNGTFTMDGGSVSDNTASNSGGGVYVFMYGTFTMGGSASVSGNTAAATSSAGGGVFSFGAFTMNGSASVSGNTAPSGGGVTVGGATFTMNGGRIQGSAGSDGFTKNTATSGSGAALYVNETNAAARFGAGSTDCKVGTTDKAAGDDIVSGGGRTDDTIVATGTGS
ncbi:MAG: S-layer homology domain-containing protein [Treponematales bacterium]